MNIILFDTNILIDHLKGKSEATDLLIRSTENDGLLSCSVISVIELKTGMRPDEEMQLARFMMAFEKKEVTVKIADIAGQYMNQYRKSHGINMADAIIAATARASGAKLHTLNRKHYPMADIEIIIPY
jgi:predicted nucleic acid-binding protein